MAKNFVIVDGSSLLHRAYHSSLPDEIKYAKTEEEKAKEYWRLNKSEGHYINAIDGFIADIVALKYFQKADYIAVCFDGSREGTFRRELYNDYKAQRSPSPEPLTDQMIFIQDLCKEMGLPVFKSKEYEADDYAGSIAKQLASDEIHVNLLTTDRDYFQLIDKNIDCFWMCNNKSKYEILDETYGRRGAPIGCIRFDKYVVKEEIGIWPNQIADWKGISGDVSDNIPGIKGVADKAAIPLLQKYNTLDRILEKVNSTSEKELKEEWKEEFGFKRSPVGYFKKSGNDGLFFKELATIKTDIEVPQDIESYKYELNLDILLDIVDRLGINKPLDVLMRVNGREEDIKYTELEGNKEKPNDIEENQKEKFEVEYDENEIADDFDIFG